jgi:hypothetical protein
VLGEPPFVELQSAALEGVGLEHLGAGVEHRGVDALDHVGAVEHERLVALALEPAVILGGEVELLQGRAHAAVEHDDALADRLQVVAFNATHDETVSPPSTPGCSTAPRAWALGRLLRLPRAGSLDRSGWNQGKSSGASSPGQCLSKRGRRSHLIVSDCLAIY